MKIAINTRFLLKDQLEGIGRVSYELIKRLVEQHPEDEFLFYFDRPFNPDFIFSSNVKAYVLRPPARHPVLWYLWFEYAVARALREQQPDVFFSPDNYLSLNAETPTVMVTHDLAHLHYPGEIPYLVRKYYDYYVPRFIRRAEHIISVSEFTKGDIIKQYQINAQKITVAHNACSEDFKPVSKPVRLAIKEKYTEGADYFFYLGSIHPRKNIDRLILAFERFKRQTKSSMKLVIGGRLAWESEKIKKALKESSHKKDIVQLGFIADDELPAILSTASALIYVSLFEGFGLPILEAMHAEVPVVTSRASSMPEVAGDAAILVNPTSVQEIAESMEQVLDPKTAKSLIERGKTQRTKFNWDKSAVKVYEVLKKVAN